MTNIQDPTNQSYSNYKLYADNLDGNITFIIPVYNNMPESTKKTNRCKIKFYIFEYNRDEFTGWNRS